MLTIFTHFVTYHTHFGDTKLFNNFSMSQLGFDILTVSAGDRTSEHYFAKKSSGLYRSGFVVLTVEAVAGNYEVVPSTFSPGQEGPFFLTVASNSSFKLSKTR